MPIPEPEEAPPDRELPPRWSLVSELHLTLQDLLLQLHRATVQRGACIEEQEPAEGLWLAGRRFEELLEALPDSVRRMGAGRLEEEMASLQRQDAEATQEVQTLSARAEALQGEVDAHWRKACEELCGPAVSILPAEDLQSEEPASGRDAGQGSGRGPVPRLQDLNKDQSRRFLEELEFLQCLANPDYLQWLASNHYFEDPAFVAFLQYLQYWRSPPYIQHVVFPQSLRVLEMLQNPAIRCRLHRIDTRALLQGQMLWTWSLAPETVLEPSKTSSSSKEAACFAAEGKAPEDPMLDLKGLEAGPERKACSLGEGALAVGKAYFSKSMEQSQLDRAMEKFKDLWVDETGKGDLLKVAGSQLRFMEIPQTALDRAVQALAPPAEPPRKIRRR